jgi:hypothetical protein
MSLLPYKYPTSTLIIDDNANLLRALEVGLDNSSIKHYFSEPEEAKQFLQGQQGSWLDLSKHCLTSYNKTEEGAENQQLFGLDFDLIEQKISDSERFSEISVLIIDYDLGVTNPSGLDLCKELTTYSCKKVLFTSVANEETAVKAFNEGIIDQFIRKTSVNLLANITDIINQQQQAYFRQSTNTLIQLINLKPSVFLNDPLFETYFRKLLAEHKLIEYYLVANPGGYLLVNKAGDTYRLLVYTKEELNQLEKYITAFNVPKALRNALQQRTQAPYLWQDPHDFELDGEPWEEYFFPIEKLAGKVDYYVHLMKDPPVDINFLPEKNSYEAYLSKLARNL